MTRPAGPFSAWLAAIRSALAGRGDSDVACGECDACCRSSQFVQIAPDETDTLAHVPSALLFPAPRLPKGHVLLGYDERGRCPMLGDHGCTIYEHRPRTCRVYDCRVFAAAGMVPDEPDKAAIARRAAEWVFEHPSPQDRDEHTAVERAAAWLRANGGSLPPADAPRTSTQFAVTAVEVADLFGGVAAVHVAAVATALSARGRS